MARARQSRGMSVRSTDGLAEAVARMDDIGDRARGLKPALEASVAHWQASERRRFRTTRGWKRDSRAWIREKRRRGLDPRTMRATGRLEAALVNANRGAGALTIASDSTLTVGIQRGRSDIYYGWILAKRTHGGRQPVTFDRQAKDATGVTVMRFVVSGVISA